MEEQGKQRRQTHGECAYTDRNWGYTHKVMHFQSFKYRIQTHGRDLAGMILQGKKVKVVSGFSGCGN